MSRERKLKFDKFTNIEIFPLSDTVLANTNSAKLFPVTKILSLVDWPAINHYLVDTNAFVPATKTSA